MLQASDGYLYPLPKAFLFVHKPTILIRFDEVWILQYYCNIALNAQIDSISFQRDNFSGQVTSQSFDIMVPPSFTQVIDSLDHQKRQAGEGRV
jgi:hypothetical protein